MTLVSETVARVRCESRGGNPAAVLKWFIDGEEEELDGGTAAVQKNETDIGDKRLWNAVSILEYSFKKVYP